MRFFDRPYALLTLAILFWSGNFVLGRAIRADIPPIALSFWRWACAAFVIVWFALPHVRHDWPLIRRHWPILLLFAFLGVTMFNTLVYSGLQFTVAINALLMQAMMPVLIVGISFLLFRERFTWQQAVGLSLSLLGAFLIIVQGNLAVLRTLSLNRGDVLVFAASVLYALYTALLRKRPRLHPLTFLAATFIPGALMILPLYLWELGAVGGFALNWQSLLAIGYVAVFPSILAYLFYNRGVELAGANRGGQFLYLMPVFGGLMAVGLLGERLFWYHGAGALVRSRSDSTSAHGGRQPSEQ